MITAGREHRRQARKVVERPCLGRFGFPMPCLRFVRGLWLLVAMAVAAPVLAGSSMRCGSRLVEEEDYAAEVIAACGEPALRDTQAISGPHGGLVADTEIWTYDFGPQKLLRLVKLQHGQVSRIETDGYGFPPGSSGARRCEPSRISDGLSKYRLLRHCGEPLTRRSEAAYRPLFARPEIYRHDRGAYASGNQYVTPVHREEWVYNFGSRTPMRRVILEDGRVTDVETIDRGFDR